MQTDKSLTARIKRSARSPETKEKLKRAKAKSKILFKKFQAFADSMPD